MLTLAEALRRLHQQKLPIAVLDDLKKAEDLADDEAARRDAAKA
jgi:hypothetical protein